MYDKRMKWIKVITLLMALIFGYKEQPKQVLGTQVQQSLCYTDGVLPDRKCTPGAIDTRVTQENIYQTICVKGYTDKVRPKVKITEKIKKERLVTYGLTGRIGDYELDHLISLELGGNPDATDNLWPEAYMENQGARSKDVVENFLNKQVCEGKMSLKDAQEQIATDWTRVETGL